jgi:hypothetical protein
MTYYKFAEQQADSTVDWSVISKNLSDTINQIDKDRQEKKAALDAQLQEDLQQLTDVPAGENKTASEFALRFGDQMTQYRLMINRMLKSGQMSLADYKIAQQNSKASTEQVFGLVDEYNVATKDLMERQGNGGSVGELQLAGSIQSLGNIGNTSFWINPTTGTVGLASVEKGIDGVNKMGGNYVSPNVLRQRLNTRIDYFDPNAYLQEQGKGLAEFTESNVEKLKGFFKTGLVEEIQDATVRDEYQQWENNTIGSLTKNNFKMLSLLTDSMPDQEYRATYDKEAWENDKTGKLVLVEADDNGILTPKIKPEQKKVVEDYMKKNIRNYITRKEKLDPFSEQQQQIQPQYEWMWARGEDEKKKTSALSYWNNLYYGNNAQKRAAAQNLLGTDRAMELGIVDIDVSRPGIIILKNADPNLDRTINYDPSKTTINDWAAIGSELHGIGDKDKISDYVKRSGAAGKKINSEFSDARANREGFDVNKYADLNVGKSLIKEGDAEQTAASLNTIISGRDYGGLRFKVSPDDSDLVLVMRNGKQVAQLSVNKTDQFDEAVRIIKKNVVNSYVGPKIKKQSASTTPAAADNLGGVNTSGFNKKK